MRSIFKQQSFNSIKMPVRVVILFAFLLFSSIVNCENIESTKDELIFAQVVSY